MASHWAHSPGPRPAAHAPLSSASPSSSSSQLSPWLGQTRSRTLLFLSYRDTAARTTKRGASLYSHAPYTDADDDPLHSSSVNVEQQGLLGGSGGGGRTSSSSSSARNSIDQRRPHTVLSLDGQRAGDDLPPKWMDISDQVDHILASIRPRMSTLDRLHEKHLRPGFADKTAEERQIEALALSITQDFRRCSRLVAGLASFTQHLIREAKKQSSGSSSTTTTTVRQIALAQNVQTALATKVQDLSGAFRKQQSLYLRRMKGMEVRDRDIRAAQGLAGGLGSSSSSSGAGGGSAAGGGARDRDGFRDSELAVREDMELSRTVSSHPTSAQSQDLLTPSNTTASADFEITQRDREITEIAKSIQELATLFGDLQSLVIDQGTLLDRIDFNVELMGREMEGAVKELETATRYQRRSGRRQCILLLILCCALLLAILIIKPFWRFFAAGLPASSSPDEGEREGRLVDGVASLVGRAWVQ